VTTADVFELETAAPVAEQKTPTERHRPGDSWRPVDLSAVFAADYVKPRPLVGSVAGSDIAMFYPGRVNTVFGDSGGGKTWYALHVMAEEIRAGHDVVLIDYEDSAESAIARLEQIGISPREIMRHLLYIHPNEKWSPAAERALRETIGDRDISMATLDSTGEALAVDGISPNADEEVAMWFRGSARFFSKEIGAAVILLDHVVKSQEHGRNSEFASGSGRKRAAINGAAYFLKVVEAPSKTTDGLFRLVTRKCRFGWRQHGSIACEVKMENTGNGDEVRFTVTQPTGTSTPIGRLRPTWYMEQVSQHLECASEPQSKNTITKAIGRKKAMTSLAIQLLLDEGFCTSSDGPRGAKLITLVKPYRETPVATEGAAIDNPF
jgi:hypothetical protein